MNKKRESRFKDFYSFQKCFIISKKNLKNTIEKFKKAYMI